MHPPLPQPEPGVAEPGGSLSLGMDYKGYHLQDSHKEWTSSPRNGIHGYSTLPRELTRESSLSREMGGAPTPASGKISQSCM